MRAEIFGYCERGLNPSFWAEPFNALTNVAFLLAAIAAFLRWRALPADQPRQVEFVLIGLVFVIGIGSFLFHTLATRWAAIADTAPIGIFMIAYLGFAARRYLGLGVAASAAVVVVFIASMPAAGLVHCKGSACLNGSVGYLPALIALVIVGAILSVRRHAAGAPLLAAGGVFMVSLFFRSVDKAWCPYTLMTSGEALGTHFLWHMLNATVLYILLRTALASHATADCGQRTKRAI